MRSDEGATPDWIAKTVASQCKSAKELACLLAHLKGVICSGWRHMKPRDHTDNI